MFRAGTFLDSVIVAPEGLGHNDEGQLLDEFKVILFR